MKANPLTYVDPTGHFAFLVPLAWAGIAWLSVNLTDVVEVVADGADALANPKCGECWAATGADVLSMAVPGNQAPMDGPTSAKLQKPKHPHPDNDPVPGSGHGAKDGADGQSGHGGGDGECKPPKGGGGTTDTRIVDGKTIAFGHGGRRDVPGFSNDQVNTAIANEVAARDLQPGFNKFEMMIGPHKMEVRTYLRDDGTINVGTYFILESQNSF